MGTLGRRERLPGDFRPDEGTPARGGLVRALTGFGNWAMTYSGIGVSAGLFELFGFSFGFSGPAMIWGWPLVAVGTLTVVLMWAELSSHYPYAGVMYKWPTILGGRTAGWFTGWLYLFANIALATSSFAVVWLGFVPLLGLTYTVKLGVLMALLTLVVCAALNLIGIKLLGPLTERAVLLELTVVGLVLILLLIFGHHNSPAIYVSSAGTGATFGKWLPGFLGGGMFVALWVFYFFETAGTLGEETLAASKNAPRAVMRSFVATFIVGGLTLLIFILAIPHVGAAMKSSSPIVYIIDAALPGAFGKIYLAVICLVILLGANVAFTAATRHMYSMARDNQLPFSSFLSRTRADAGVPWASVIVVAVISAIPFIASQSFAVIVTGATAFFYAIYFGVMVVTLRARLRGWPREAAPFSLGKWGIPVNIIAVVWTGVMAVNLFWFRAATNPVFGGLHVAFWMVGAPLAVGLAYWALVQRRRLREAARLPAETGATEASATGAEG
jgi:amino acid transporter